MKSSAASVEQYLASLPADRRAAVSAVRRVILDHLDADIQECMQYGVIGYCVPHRVWAHGHHTNPKLPLMYMGLSSQKNDMVVYMLFLLHNESERAWFDKAWKATGRKSYLEVGGMGCCLRFKGLDDLALEVVAEAMGRVPVKKYLEDHVAMLARRGKGPDGKTIKRGSGTAKTRAKAERAKVEKKTTRKAGAKRG